MTLNCNSHCYRCTRSIDFKSSSAGSHYDKSVGPEKPTHLALAVDEEAVGSVGVFPIAACASIITSMAFAMV